MHRPRFPSPEGETHTSTFQAIVLGIVQGVTEFAPVSSSGHLILVPWLFHWTFFLRNPDLNKTFDVALHIGTFAGALVYFRRDILGYILAWVRSIRKRSIDHTDERLAWLLVIGTIPGAIAGAVAESFIEEKLGKVWLIAVMLAVFGVLLYVVDKRAKQTRRMRDLRTRDAVLIGLAQAVALQPGVSRSGVTMTAGRALGLRREAAARFSFLLSMPIIAGAGLAKGYDLAKAGLPPGTEEPFLWGMLASAVSGFLVIWGLLAYLRRRDFAPFVLYRLAVAGLVLGLIATGVRTASGL
ncbi:MAG TPA: undecaprenyl-diphosphatase UppP [Actinomycetota bacterium]|nr:undecaprenyl-diphosphatase UppP [Actinomycetota bacterium]